LNDSKGFWTKKKWSNWQMPKT